ncbi:MAG: alpha/beta fold hydrolase [Planctomycetota bacterium]
MPGLVRRHRVKLSLLAAYAALLAVSNAFSGSSPALDPRKLLIELPQVTGAGPVEGALRGSADPLTELPYLFWRAPAPLEGAGATPVILLHGSPGDANNFAAGPGFGGWSAGLGSALARERDAYALDLPGMGQHDERVPSRSSRAHAHSVLAFMDATGVERAHVVGWSQGGAVALFVADLAPERLESLTLLAAVGAQETEGSGGYVFEHAKYAVGIAAAHALEWLVPHFGRLDTSVKALQRSMHNFWDTDQRPLRRVLETAPVPIMILHGRQDFLVAPWAAQRHHEIRPDATLVLLNDAGHFMPFLQPERTADLLGAFFDGARNDRVDPAASTFGRVGSSLARWLHLTPWLVVAAGFAGLAFFVPVQTAAVAGLLVATLHADLGVMLVSLWAGHGARQAARGGRAGPAVLVPVLAMAFAPPVASGVSAWEGPTGRAPIAWLLAAGVVSLAVYVVPNLLRRRGRRNLRRTAERSLRHEFWPAVVFYLPLLPRLVWLSVRFGGVRVWTRCNPGISARGGVGGGIVGESKSKIQDALGEHPAVLRTVLIGPGPSPERVNAAMDAVRDCGGFPAILKPDAGQRGFAVRLARTEDDVRAYEAVMPRPFVAQAYHPGPEECGVMVVRRPGADRHEVYSVTRKTFPSVVGDGVVALGELVWKHPRYRLQAPVFEERWGHRWDDVLGEGEVLRLAEAGNHSQGTMFSDGADLLTPELAEAIAELAGRFEGFDFGRFDLRYTSDEDLRAGRGFGVVELNGVTAESTNLYDPSWGVRRAYRTLFDQWRTAYEIGAFNRSRGVEPVRLGELVAALRGFYRRRPRATSS